MVSPYTAQLHLGMVDVFSTQIRDILQVFHIAHIGFWKKGLDWLDDRKRWKRWDVFSAVAMGGGGGGTVICRLLGVKIGVGNVEKNTVNYRKNCFLRMFAGMRSRKKNAFFLHGSSIFEFLVLCCMQPLGCVMCKKHCKYREKIAFGAMWKHLFNPNGRVTLLRFIWGLFWPSLRHFRVILGHFGPMFGPTTYWVSWKAICWVYLGPSGNAFHSPEPFR